MKDKPLAVIVFEDDGNTTAQLLWRVVKTLQAKGLAVDGLLNKLDEEGNYVGEVICSLNDEREYRILVDRGAGAQGCRLDSVALAESSAVPREALDRGIDLLVLNKFGIAESEGEGLIAELARAVSEGVPVLSTVHDKYADAWREFSGDLGIELFPMEEEVLEWVEAQFSE